MHAETLFCQFRRTGEPACLGQVFDLWADDLFAVALHLCRDRVEAEDLVQATFVVAIERAQHYTAGRPLRAWLLGILHREAKRAARRGRRVPDQGRLPERPEASPAQLVLAAETAAAVRQALGAVPQPYRDVVELHLLEALPAGSIAAQLRRSPGAVRTQLWRGLEQLRRLLPKGLLVGVAGGLGADQARAAVRERVLEVALAKHGAVGVGAGIGGLIGGLMMKKLLVGLVMLCGVVLWWWQVSSVALPTVTSRDDVAQLAGLPTAAAVGPDVDAGNVAQRTDAADPAAAAAPAAVSGALVGPEAAVLAVVVVDRRGDPVLDAAVVVYAAATRTEASGERVTLDYRVGDEPIQRMNTDNLGRCRVQIDGPVLISASKAGVGWSGNLRASKSHSDFRKELRITLAAIATVRGVVLRQDGLPASGAHVRCRYFGGDRDVVSEMDRQVTDERGAFTFQALAGWDYSVLATHEGRYTGWQPVPELKEGQVFDVTLQFAGAFAVRGVLRDPTGAPLQGKVVLVDAAAVAQWSAKTDEHGAFELLLTRGGTFQLVGGAEGHTPMQVALVLDAARPQAVVTLQTEPFVTVAGKVVDERGAPCAGMLVGLAPEVRPEDAVQSARNSLQGSFARGTTATDGTFQFLAATGCDYRLVCQMVPGNRDLWFRSQVFAAPIVELVVTVRDGDRQGFRVEGKVLAAADDAVIDGVSVTLITFEGSGSSSQGLARSTQGRLIVGPLPVGRRYALECDAEGYATATVGPFDATVRTEQVTVRLQRCGKVRCRVLRADGTAAVMAFVSLKRNEAGPFERAWQGSTDAAGWIEFTEVIPGMFRVFARNSQRSDQAPAEGQVHVLPNQASELQIVLRQ